ncbi:phospholipase effector Tle1 domain-containing protein [Sphaerotilaceae bacterium SBD11-9]
MNVRFAEACRTNHLGLEDVEREIERRHVRDGRTQQDLLLPCEKDIYLGFFFDGTNNNKYRDTAGYSHSNVARLYEVFPGTPAAQKAPTFQPRINPDGSTTARPVFPDRPFKASSVAEEDFPYYRKVYVPGVGTPMPDVGDSGTGAQRTGGLVAALLGQIRLDWATLQLLNQIHAAIFKAPLEASIDMGALWQQDESAKLKSPSRRFMLPQTMAGQAIADMLASQVIDTEKLLGRYDPERFENLFKGYQQRLLDAVKRYGNNKPRMRKIRLSVFGFSRGAAEARAWVNMATQRFGGAVAGIPLQIDFLGIFDTVASVGLAQSTPKPFAKDTFSGHAAWADDQYMPVPASVKRCVHLVAAFEVRGSFPLDSVCQGNMLPPNCKEVVYPGVHSDVGGGYPPDDQGRALGQGAAGDKRKLSQLSLAQMYREARMAGVPLAPEPAMLDFQKANFAVDPQLREDFNAYIAATRSGSVPPTNGKGEPSFASMYPTETQPREELLRVMRRHYGILLRWRKAMMNRPGGMAGLPGLAQSRSISRFQDAEDFRGAEEELRREIVFLQSTDPKKFDRINDLALGLIADVRDQTASATALAGPLGPLAVATGSVAVFLTMKGHESIQDVMRDKQRQWDTWLQHEWADHGPMALPAAAEALFSRYVHDSRAWFKVLFQTNGRGMPSNDEDWFVFGGREKEKAARIREQQEALAAHRKSGDAKAMAAAQQALTDLQQEGQPLLQGGREPYQMWGYVRHRRVYQSGQLRDAAFASRQQSIEREEHERVLQQRRQEQIAQENARHESAVQALRDRNKQVIQDNKLSESDRREFTAGTRMQIERENREHLARLKEIEAKTTAVP